MPTSALGNAIAFLQAFGFFDVVLPFLLVFTIVFGILEKTKILGIEGKDKLPKKNLNAMVAFAIAFFVVAASNIVQAIQVSLPAISMVLLIVVVFMLLLGSIAGESEKGLNLWTEHKWAAWTVTVFVIISILAIFLYAFGYLEFAWAFIAGNLSSTTFATILLIILIFFAIKFILKPAKKPQEENK